MFGSRSSKKTGLKIIIVGCGKVGVAILKQLANEGHDITIIDKDPQKVATYANQYDVMGIVGNGANHSVQLEAGIQNADLIAAVTSSDELNILCCTIAKQVGDCATIARLRDPDYSKEASYLREKLGLTMIINPELETAIEVSRVLYLPTALEINSFAHGQAEMTRIKIPEKNVLDNKSIADLGKDLANKQKPINILIAAVERAGEFYIPSGDFVLKAGDIMSCVGTRPMSRKFMEHIGFKTARVKNTMIIGGGNVAYYLAGQLVNMGISVKIIEENKKRCEELSVLLPRAIIINGDGTDQETEEHLKKIISMGPRLAMASRGAKGCILYDGEKFFVQPAMPLKEVKDTLGAGDSMIASFLTGYTGRIKNGVDQDVAIRESLKEAAAFAAGICGIEGAFGCGKKYE